MGVNIRCSVVAAASVGGGDRATTRLMALGAGVVDFAGSVDPVGGEALDGGDPAWMCSKTTTCRQRRSARARLSGQHPP